MKHCKKPEIRKQYMKVLRPCLHFHGIQIKSADCFRKFAAAVNEIETLVGIHSCNISMEEIFVCPDMRIEELETSTPTELLLKNMICKMDTLP